MVRKNPDGSEKDPGQQYEEVVEAQKKKRQRRKGIIDSTKGSKIRDKEELRQFAAEAMRNRKKKHK